MATGNRRMNAKESGEVLTAEEVAELLKMSRKTVVRHFNKGTIKAKRIGTQWRCLRSSVDTFFASA